MSFTGVGTVLRRGQGTNPIPAVASDTFDDIGKVQNISGPNIQKERVADDTLDSAGGFHEYLSGLRDGGTVEFPLSFEPGTTATPLNSHQAVIGDVFLDTADARRNWQVEWPDGTVVDFQAEVFGVNFNTEPNSPVTATITLQINLGVTITYP